jgi:hypothetical protein
VIQMMGLWSMHIAPQSFVAASAAFAAVGRRSVSSSAAAATAARTAGASQKQPSAANKKPFRLYARPHQKDQLFRADRVVANRSGKPRKECFRLLQERRIFDAHGHSIDGPATKIRNDTPLYIDGRHPVPLPPPLLAVYHKPKVRVTYMVLQYGTANTVRFYYHEEEYSKKYSFL